MFDFKKITGLACKLNRTLSFLSMDSFNYGLVAEKLGVPLKHAVHSTAAIIIDGQVFEMAIFWKSFYRSFSRGRMNIWNLNFHFRMNLPMYLKKI